MAAIRPALLAVTAACALVGLAPAPAAALSLPDSCTIMVTAEHRDCWLTSFARCDVEGTTEGAAELREISYTGEGVEEMHRYDGDGQWLEAWFVDDDERAWLVGTPEARFSNTALGAGERVRYAFEMVNDWRGIVRRNRSTSTVEGWVVLTGEEQTVDGEVLLEARMHETVTEAGETHPFEVFDAQALFLADAGVMLFGQVRLEEDGEIFDEDWSPLRLHRPGDARFGAERASLGCSEDGTRAALEEVGQ